MVRVGSSRGNFAPGDVTRRDGGPALEHQYDEAGRIRSLKVGDRRMWELSVAGSADNMDCAFKWLLTHRGPLRGLCT